jgi:hypothetical protein
MKQSDDTYINVPLQIGEVFIPINTVVTDVHIIAGMGTPTELRVSDRLSEKYGGYADDWKKYVGKIESSRYVFDIHWYGNDTIGNYEYKIKSYKEKGWRQ